MIYKFSRNSFYHQVHISRHIYIINYVFYSLCVHLPSCSLYISLPLLVVVDKQHYEHLYILPLLNTFHYKRLASILCFRAVNISSFVLKVEIISETWTRLALFCLNIKYMFQLNDRDIWIYERAHST